MTQFDDLVAKYRNLTYGRLASNNPSAIKSLLETTDKSISNPQYFGNIDPRQQQYLDTPSGLIAQNRFRIDPETGIPIFETPASESIKSASGTYDPNIDYGDPGYAGVIPEDPSIVTDPVLSSGILDDRGGDPGQRGGMPTAEDQGYSYSGTPGMGGSASYNNPAYGALGDTFSPAPGIGMAYDEYGRKRDIGILADLGLNTYDKMYPAVKTVENIVENLPVVNFLKTIFGKKDPDTKTDSESEAKTDSVPDLRVPDQIGIDTSGGSGGSDTGGTPSSGPSGDDAATGKGSGMPSGQSKDSPRDGGNPGGNSGSSGTGSTGTGGQSPGPQGQRGGTAGGDSSGKIICTMMNEFYGFGSYRNAIWLKYSRDHLLPEHEIGYHKIFLPLVAHAKGKGLSNYIVKIVIEHLTRHRTIDCKQEMRGKKRHTLGRIYRAIFEPLCYIVGKYGK